MTDLLLDELKRRAFQELGRHDGVGSVLNLNYRENQILKKGDPLQLRPILDKQLKRYRRSLWWMGIAAPVSLAIVYWWFGTVYTAVVLTLLFVGEAAFLLKVSLPRIAAMERARVLFDTYEAFASRAAARERVETSSEARYRSV